MSEYISQYIKHVCKNGVWHTVTVGVKADGTKEDIGDIASEIKCNQEQPILVVIPGQDHPNPSGVDQKRVVSYWKHGYMHDHEWLNRECLIQRTEMDLWVETQHYRIVDGVEVIFYRTRVRVFVFIQAKEVCGESVRRAWMEFIPDFEKTNEISEDGEPFTDLEPLE